MNIFFAVSIICFAVCFIMFLYLQWYIKKRTSASGLEEHRAEVERLKVDINSVVDRNLQLVEDSISKLKKLMEDAEKRIAEYKDAIEIKPSGDALYTNLGRGVRAALINPSEQLPPPQLQAEHPLKSPKLSLELQRTAQLYEMPSKSENKTAPSAPPVHKPPSKKQLRGAIDLLANDGLSAEEIASRLDISIAQVNLAMNLRRTKR
jgi:hypothetical protein